MNKYIISFVALFNLAQLYCEIPILPATNAQVRKFRTQFANEIQETKRKNNLQYDAIAIFVFINELKEGNYDFEKMKELEQKFEIIRHLDKDLYPLQIVEGVRLGYGFDRGVCSDLVVSAEEQSKYKAALTSIGRHITADSERATVRHVFSQSPLSPAISEHISISNALMYKASPGDPALKFMYAPSEYAANRALENSIDLSPEEVSEFGDKGHKYVKSLAPPEYNLDDLNKNKFSFFGSLTHEDLEKIRDIFTKDTSSATFLEKMEASVTKFLGHGPDDITREQLEKFPRLKALVTALESQGYLYENLFACLRYYSVTFSTYLTFAACADIPEIQQGPEQESQKLKFFRRFQAFPILHPYLVQQSLSMPDDQLSRCIECATNASGTISNWQLEELLALPEAERETFLNRKTQYKGLSYSNVKQSLSMSDAEFDSCIECTTDASGTFWNWQLEKLLALSEAERETFLTRKTQYKGLSYSNVKLSLSMSDAQFNSCIECTTDASGTFWDWQLEKLLKFPIEKLELAKACKNIGTLSPSKNFVFLDIINESKATTIQQVNALVNISHELHEYNLLLDFISSCLKHLSIDQIEKLTVLDLSFSGISKDQRRTTFETIIQKLDSIPISECSDIAEMQSGERIATLLAK